MLTASAAKSRRTRTEREGILWASEAGVDSIEHGSYIDDAGIAAMKQHGTYLVPTLYLMDWFLENAAEDERSAVNARQGKGSHSRGAQEHRRRPSPAV